MVTPVGTVITVGTRMFKDNKYTKHYMLFIEKAKSRILPKETYTEKHHIIPRSMGGNNKKENLVELTAREHFICHWLLIKMTTATHRNKMLHALMFMSGKNEHQKRYFSETASRTYERHRLALAESMKGNVPANKGKPGKKWTPEQIEDRTGRSCMYLENETRYVKKEEVSLYLSLGWKLGLPESRKLILRGKPAHNKGKPRNEADRKKISEALKGKKLSQKQINTRIDRVWIHNSSTMKFVKRHEVDSWLHLGWILGRSNSAKQARIGKISITNGVDQKFVDSSSVQSWLDIGWYLGRKPKITKQS